MCVYAFNRFFYMRPHMIIIGEDSVHNSLSSQQYVISLTSHHRLYIILGVIYISSWPNLWVWVHHRPISVYLILRWITGLYHRKFNAKSSYNIHVGYAVCFSLVTLAALATRGRDEWLPLGGKTFSMYMPIAYTMQYNNWKWRVR